MPNETKTGDVIAIEQADHVSLWLELKRGFIRLRGATIGPNTKAVPRTTNRDVLLLATRWSAELAKAKGGEARDRQERERWKACLDEVQRLTKTAEPGAEYTNNVAFWDGCTNRLAIYLESLKLRPSKWELAAESLGEAIEELPETLGHAGKAAAQTVGGFVRDHLLLGAAVLGAVVLLPPLLRGFRK